MTFARPELLALGPLAVLIACLAVIAQRRRALRLVEAYGGAEPARRLAERDLRAFPTTRLASLIVAAVAVTIAAAGPEAPPTPPDSAQPIDLVVALDISLSMSVEDLGQSRAERATEILGQVTEAIPSEHIGIAAFADWPYTLVPLTHDLDVVRFFGATLDPELVADRDQGTELGAVVRHARAVLDSRRRPNAEGVILLLSDGEGHGDVTGILDSVAAATTDGVRLFTGGIGTDVGGPIVRPGSPGDLLVDESGAPVVSRLEAPLLRQMAEVGGGRYHDLSSERGVRSLMDELAGPGRDDPAPQSGPDPVFWLTLLALPMLLWEGVADSGRRVLRIGRWGVPS
jgi:Ca-activated chloride channel family protein